LATCYKIVELKAVLKTLDSYIDESAAADFWSALLSRYFGNRRLARIFAFSVIGHVFFYAWLINLDMSTDRWHEDYSGAQTELIKITEIAPSLNRPPLRSAPEPVEETDINRMEFDPDRADDVHLRSRSQKLGRTDAETSSPRLPRENARNQSPAPPAPSSAKIERVSPPAGVVISQFPAPRSAPPVPASIHTATAPSSTAPPPARSVARSDASSGTAELGLETIRAQYMAQVRAKIRKANERIMPRKWVEDMLTNKVSADFELLLGRGGRILSTRLSRSTGYSQLDDIAKQAIYMASPYEGYPQEAGETIALTVTVYYHP
jgi:outer membrane biosynthesis protein TonB